MLGATQIFPTSQDMNKLLKRELEVAFSKHAQPVWFRVLKYVILASPFYFLWGNKWLWIILGGIVVLGLILHFWYRHKTHGWRQSYGMWKHEDSRKK